MKYKSKLDSIRAYNEFLGGKWRLIIIEKLIYKTLRFKELLAEIENITPKMLTKELKTLEKYSLLEKEIYREAPPRVEYTLSDKGVNLFPLIESIKRVGDLFMNDISNNPHLLDKAIEKKIKKVAKKEPNPQDIFIDDNSGLKFVKIINKDTEESISKSKKRIEDLDIEEIKIFDEEILILEKENALLENSVNEITFSNENSEMDTLFDINKNKSIKKHKKEKPKPRDFIQLELF